MYMYTAHEWRRAGDRTRRDRFSERKGETAVAKFEDLRQKEKGNVRKSPKYSNSIHSKTLPNDGTVLTCEGKSRSHGDDSGQGRVGGETRRLGGQKRSEKLDDEITCSSDVTCLMLPNSDSTGYSAFTPYGPHNAHSGFLSSDL
jgi:hypothetical protein